jgi:hypothetical protein
MKRNHVSVIELFGCLLFGSSLISFCPASQGAPIVQQQNIILSPLLQEATLDGGYGSIPFAVENKASRAVKVMWQRGGGVVLMTLTDSNSRITLARFSDQINFTGAPGIHPAPVLLRPGETGTFNSPYSTAILGFVAGKGKEIFGGLEGEIVDTNEKFKAFSDPFPVPAQLAKPPFADWGSQGYFSVAVDLVGAVFQGGNMPDTPVIGEPTFLELIKKRWADALVIPVKITNLTNQKYIVVVDHAMVYPGASRGTAPSAWDSVQAQGPTLAPGGSITPLIPVNLHDLQNQGYKPGDEYLAAVGGRIPNTNQVFECYSAPFKLPPLPKDHPAK